MKTTKFEFVIILLIVGSLVAIISPSRVVADEAPILFPEGDIDIISRVLPSSGYPADVYFPRVRAAEDAFPIVAFLQGAFVDKLFYRKFGRQLARFGFVVVIPNRSPVPFFPPPFTLPDPFPDEFLILDVLALMIVEDNSPASTSPLSGIVDTDSMGLAGHSAGGAAGLLAIGGICHPPFCFGPPDFPLPEAVRGGAFYGTNTIIPGTTDPIPVNTNGIPVALVQGTRDGIATLEDAMATLDEIVGPKVLIPIIDDGVDRDPGANHYGITDVNNPPGAIPDIPVLLPPPNIVQPESIKLIAQATGEFLLEALTGDSQLIPGEFPVSSKKKLDVDNDVSVNGRGVAKGKTEADSVVDIDANRDTVNQFLPNLVPPVFPKNTSQDKIKVESDRSFVSSTPVAFKEIEIKKGQTASFSGGGPFHIDRLRVKKDAVLNLGAGTYFVNRFDMKDDDARINLSSAPVMLHIGHRFKVEAKRLILNAGGSVDGLRVYLHEKADFRAKEMDFTGVLYGPAGKKVEVEKATVKGAIVISGEVKIKKETAITYTQTDQALVGLTISIPE